MKNITIGKVVVNIAVGKSGEPLDKASRILNELTNHKSYQRKAKQTIKTFGIRKGEPIACMVTLRKKDAERQLTNCFSFGNKNPLISREMRGKGWRAGAGMGCQSRSLLCWQQWCVLHRDCHGLAASQ